MDQGLVLQRSHAEMYSNKTYEKKVLMWLTTFPRTIGLTLGIVQTNIGLRSRYTPKQPDVSLYRQPAINDEKNKFLFASLNLQNNILLRGVYWRNSWTACLW